MKRNPKAAKIITFHAVLVAMMFLSVVFPKFGPLSLAVLPLIAVLISALFLGFWHGVFSGLLFGLISLIANIAVPSSVLAPMFQNPLISVLPRIFIGITAYGSALLMRKLFSKAKPFLIDAIACFVGVITNTALVLGLMLLIYNGNGVVTPVVIGGIILSNSLLEIAVCTLLTPAIIAALKKSVKF